MRPICTAPNGFASCRSPLYRSSPSHVASDPQLTCSGSQAILPPAREAERLEPHRFEGDVAGQHHQVGPRDLAAVLLFDRPEQPARLVEVGVVGPAAEGREAQHARPRAAAAVVDAVGPGTVPRHPDEQGAVMAEVRRPPVLRRRHHRRDVLLQRIEVERLELFSVVERRVHRIACRVIGMKRGQIQLIRPPVAVRPALVCTARERALGFVVHGVVDLYCGRVADGRLERRSIRKAEGGQPRRPKLKA